jgi:3-hydroxyisobutyrate dehydrogenase-like beta-hydroxyacid dehydrogenase
MKIGIFGLGEAGSLIAADLVAEGVQIMAYDPADVQTPAGVTRRDRPEDVVNTCEILLALTAGQDALFAMQQALNEIPANLIYADLSTNSVETKKQLADIASKNGFPFVDIALMGTVPGKGLRTPMLAAGSGSAKIIKMCHDLPFKIDLVSEHAGEAAMRKLLRSIMMKGLAATIIEALRAAEAAGCQDWLWQNIADEIDRADAQMISRFVRGTGKHYGRRIHEMTASQALLRQLGVTSVMTTATLESLRQVEILGIPNTDERS